MPPLPANLRKALEKAVVRARDAAESACQAALRALGVEAAEAPPGISDEQRALRVALRAKQRQLGGAFEQLVAECAYEQWHLMLFARFLAENDLLIHHRSGAPVTLDEVAGLAREQGGIDPWLLAAGYAAAMLPGIFKTSDPCVRLPLAPEGRRALEEILEALPREVFTADDGLGWVYQFWQSKKKEQVNASERKIGGADLAPVTQLFTEHYMVRFLLENSLGAWWAARHPDSPLLAEWEYLRFADDGTPAAGRFEGLPDRAAEVTVMDPCCGSGHFLVEAFDMLRKMRAEEEGLSPRETADAVLADNLFGLELDPRCIQLAAFNLALAAWKVAGCHELPPLNLACSGIPTRSSLGDWIKLAKGDARLERALARLHELFKDADTLGSLIDPRRAVEDGTLQSVAFEEVAPLLERALAGDPDPVAAVFGESAREVAQAAILLAGAYTLVVTNVPYLQSGSQCELLKTRLATAYPNATADLAVAFLLRSRDLTRPGGSLALVSPQGWRYLRSYERLRRKLLERMCFDLLVLLGSGAFTAISGEVVNVMLGVFTSARPVASAVVKGLDAQAASGARGKDVALRRSAVVCTPVATLRALPAARIILTTGATGVGLARFVNSFKGITTGDDPRFRRGFWELALPNGDWIPFLSTVSVSCEYGGRSDFLLWEEGRGALAESPGAYIRATGTWGHRGVAVSQMGSLPVSMYMGEAFDTNVGAIVPKAEGSLAPLYSYAVSGEFSTAVRQIDASLKVTNAVFVEVPFDLAYWQKVAAERYPNGLPEPYSNDPTQWLFHGHPCGSVVWDEDAHRLVHGPLRKDPTVLHVALARLLGYRWPAELDPEMELAAEQHEWVERCRELEPFADEDGIVCLPAVAGEQPAHERLRKLLEVAYGDAFSQSLLGELLASEGSSNLEGWLRDKAFTGHAKLFHNRPFVWHIWDGRPDGFSAFVNYHRLDRQNLEKLAFHYLGWWIERQESDRKRDVAGAEARLAAAQELQRKLKLILEGEPPYDIYVRWKSLAEQPLGWEPDLNDGVRLNIRPFVTAGVLRAKFSINWNKDRGKDPKPNASGTVERLNDLHFTLAEKRAAREEANGLG